MRQNVLVSSPLCSSEVLPRVGASQLAYNLPLPRVLDSLEAG